jgi:hypothetical protein
MSIYHCGDNYIPGILQYAEAADVLGLFAPKPLVVVAGKTDPIFPIKGVRKSFADLKRYTKQPAPAISLPWQSAQKAIGFMKRLVGMRC